MKRVFMMIVSALMCLVTGLSFAGCNFDSTPPYTPPQEELEDNPNAKVQLTVQTLPDTYEKNMMIRWINGYQKKNPDVGINLKQTFGAMNELDKMYYNNTMCDIVWSGGDQHSPFSQKYFVDLAGFEGATEFFDGFYETVIETTHTTEGDKGIWFVPRDYNALVVYYNKTMFKELNIAEPKSNWTWDEFVATCDALSASPGVLNALENDIAWPPFQQTMMANFGSKYFNDDASIAFDSAQTKACYDYQQEFNNKYTIQGTGSNFSAYTKGGEKNVGMYIGVRPALPVLANKAAASGWELGCVAFPNYKRGGENGFVGAGCSGYAINNKSSNEKQQEAWKFLKYCMSEEGYRQANPVGTLVPAIKSMINDPSWRNYSAGNVTVDADAFVKTDATPIFLNYYRMHPTASHQEIINAAGFFWSNVKAGSSQTYSASMSNYKQYLKDRAHIQ